MEAQSPDTLYAAASLAGSLGGVSVVSMSFGSAEFPLEGGSDASFRQAGVTFLAASGDDGSPGNYPAYSPNVVAVGGTNVTPIQGGIYGSEQGWSGSGGGLSATLLGLPYEAEPSFQTSVQQTGRRAIPDVSMDAGTWVPIYDSYDYPTSPWAEGAGTSLACPMWASLIAIANQGRASIGEGPLDGPTQTLPRLYNNVPFTDFHDVRSGTNGDFAAQGGYDEVTGRGTPIANLLVNDLAGVAPARPPNDAFETPGVLAGSVANAAGTTVGATYEVGETPNSVDSAGASVWWSWTAPARPGTVTLSVAGSDFDATVGVYTGSSITNLATIQTNIDSTGAHLPTINFAAAPGTTYRIRVDGTLDPTQHTPSLGNVQLALAFSQAPDTTPPIASLTSPVAGGSIDQSVLNQRGWIEVQFSDQGGSGLNLGSIADGGAKFTIGGAGAGTATFTGGAQATTDPSTFLFHFTGSFGTGPVTVNFLPGTWSDNAGNSNAAFNQTFTVGFKPTITAVTPSVLQPLPVDQTQLISITGTDFTAQSTLTFVSAAGHIFSGRIPSYDSTSGQLQYYISVGTNTGQWTVQVITNGIASDPFPFSVSTLPEVAEPTITPNGGSFINAATVTLATATAGATIRYTLDGTDPTASSAPYTGALTLTQSATLKARAFAPGMSDSPVQSATFEIAPSPSAPSITSVSPALLQPSTDIQNISIYGSGFQPGCLLNFYDPSGNLHQNNQTVFVTSGRLDYGLQVNAMSGTWRVQVANDPYGANIASNSFSFTVAPPPTGNYPVPASPQDGATGVVDRPTVSWNPVPGADFYRVMVATSPNLPRDPNVAGLDGSIAQWVDSPNATSEFIGAFGRPGATYYWQVQASIGGVRGAWSPIWSYTLAGELNLPPVVQTAAANPTTVTQGDTVTFTADGVSDPNLPPDHPAYVTWYVESNGVPGLQTDISNGDRAFADNDGSDGWSLPVSTFGAPGNLLPLGPGVHTVYAVATDTHSAQSDPVTFTFTVLPANVAAPSVQAATFDPSESPATLRLVFNTNVGPSLIGSDGRPLSWALQDFQISGPGNPSVQGFSYDSTSNTLTLNLAPATLEDGEYQLTIASTAFIYNAAGVALQGPRTFGFSMVSPAKTDLSLDAADATYGGTASLTATLRSAGMVLPLEPVAFTLADGTLLGTAVTDEDGRATLSAPLTGFSAMPYAVMASFAGNPTNLPSSANGTLTIAPAPLTVTVNSSSRLFGQQNPSFSVSFDGFVNGDQPSSLGGGLTYQTAADTYSPSGSYAVTASGLSSPNYAITYSPGALTIGPVILVNGRVFNDSNNNGIFENEAGLEGVTVFLDVNGDGIPNSGEKTAMTDSSGQYTFVDVPPGDYVVREVIPPGYARTTPLITSAGVSLTAAEVSAGQAVQGPLFGDVIISTVTMNFGYLLTLAQHYNQPGTFASGDLNGDDTVNFSDLLLLAQNYGHALPAASPAAASADSASLLLRKRKF